jgi:dCMP deaminase
MVAGHRCSFRKDEAVKQKHVNVWLELARSMSSLSPCVRAKHGCILLNPERNTVVATGYNGTPRHGGELCGGDRCLRDVERIPSGQRIEVGCIHAEQNALCNAAAEGRSTIGLWAIVTGEPCLMCAKLLYQAGISQVVVIDGGYSDDSGVAFLLGYGVRIHTAHRDLDSTEAPNGPPTYRTAHVLDRPPTP